MLVLKGSEAAARIKKEVQEMVEGLGGHVPTAAIVRVGERPDDLSYERNVMKKIASFGMEARSFAFPESISEVEFQAEFQKINDDPSIDGILLFCPLPRHMNGRTFEELIRPDRLIFHILQRQTVYPFRQALSLGHLLRKDGDRDRHQLLLLSA